MQNAGLDELQLNWRYLAFDVHPDQLGPAIAGAQAMGFIGLNLTVPHKVLAVDLVDALDDSARFWGAVNTIRFEGQRGAEDWKSLQHFSQDSPERVRSQGFNTDADGLTRSLMDDLDFDPRGRRILLLGAGGAGRVAALKLADSGAAALNLLNRTLSKSESLRDELAKRYPGTEVSLEIPRGSVDLVVNATSLGLRSNDCLPLDPARYDISRVTAVYDMIYRPAETPFLEWARKSGCRTANGLGMLLHQGTRALEIWSGLPSPTETMRHALEENIYDPSR